MSENLSVIIAFGAGLVSFFSPCVLPLIPSWLCIIGSSPGSAESSAAGNRPKPVIRTISFILGFSLVFIILSIVFSVTFMLAGGIFRYINIIAGLIVIILGLNILFNFLSFLNFEKRFSFKKASGGSSDGNSESTRSGSFKGLIGAFLAGGAFGAGWTPCIGPVLTGILVLAAQGGGVPRAVLYLSFFSLGLGLPFLIASFCYDFFLKLSAKFRSHLLLIQRISAVLLIVLGILITTGLYQIFSVFAAQWQPFSRTTTTEADSGSRGYENINVQANIDRTVSPQVIQAFRDARIPVLREGVPIVDFTLPKLDGSNFTLSDMQGKVVFLNYWATWCPPCRDEMPSMEALYQRLKDRGLDIIAINLGETRAPVALFVNDYNLSFPIVLDTRNITGSIYGIRSIPTTFIIDRRGFIVAHLVGSIDWYTPEIIAAFETLLSQ